MTIIAAEPLSLEFHADSVAFHPPLPVMVAGRDGDLVLFAGS